MSRWAGLSDIIYIEWKIASNTYLQAHSTIAGSVATTSASGFAMNRQKPTKTKTETFTSTKP